MFTIAIVGRPNVGKSTFFNRLVGRRKSIVEPTPGVTRDTNKEETKINGKTVCLLDTGGLINKIEDSLNPLVQEKAFKVASEANLILFLVDAQVTHPDDSHYAREIAKLNKPVILVVNKVDVDSHENSVYEFYNLGFKNVLAVSSEHNRGFGELFEKLEEYIVSDEEEDSFAGEEEEEINIAIVGKPNTGKSTMLNTLLGEDLSIVSDIAGTTRDPIDACLNFNGRKVRLVDTAGIRRKTKVSENVEYYSVNRAVKAIEKADTVILLIDAIETLSEQDKKIASLITSRKKGILIGVNKWDLIKGQSWKDYDEELRYRFPILSYAVTLSLSAKKEKDAKRALSFALRIADIRKTRIDTHPLTEFFRSATENYTISVGRSPFKIYYAVQTGVTPPSFILFCNNPDKLTEHYKRYLENSFRNMFDFVGTPIIFKYKRRNEDSSR